ncbi:MAG TPA: HEPN domain-containing protein [Anaerolineae bacterium]|nr:HEPN domain-containing protein [Anaerolineae bacterium]
MAEAERWFRQAERDIEAAANLRDSGDYNWSCFVAQQAAEKAVKALHAARGEDVERVHSILALIQGDRRTGIRPLAELQSLADAARELDRVYIPTRYPNGVPFGIPSDFFGQRNAEDCLQWAGDILETVRRQLPNMSPP